MLLLIRTQDRYRVANDTLLAAVFQQVIYDDKDGKTDELGPRSFALLFNLKDYCA